MSCRPRVFSFRKAFCELPPKSMTSSSFCLQRNTTLHHHPILRTWARPEHVVPTSYHKHTLHNVIHVEQLRTAFGIVWHTTVHAAVHLLFNSHCKHSLPPCPVQCIRLRLQRQKYNHRQITALTMYSTRHHSVPLSYKRFRRHSTERLHRVRTTHACRVDVRLIVEWRAVAYTFQALLHVPAH